MNKFKNQPLYHYNGINYYQRSINNELIYASNSSEILAPEKFPDSIFFSSLLEYQTWKHINNWLTRTSFNPRYELKLVRQFPVVLIPQTKSFPEFKHKVDFALVVRDLRDNTHTIILIESKGIITKDSMMIMRLLEDKYQAISKGTYILVLAKYPGKFPRYFPMDITKTTLINLSKLLSNSLTIALVKKNA